MTTITYRELQKALATMPCTVRRNSKRDVLQAEYDRLIALGETPTTSTESQPRRTTKTTTPSKATTPSTAPTKFDWDGLAVSRREAVNKLWALREAGRDVPKLNSTNLVLRDALRDYTAQSTPTKDAPPTPTKVTTVAAKVTTATTLRIVPVAAQGPGKAASTTSRPLDPAAAHTWTAEQRAEYVATAPHRRAWLERESVSKSSRGLSRTYHRTINTAPAL